MRGYYCKQKGCQKWDSAMAALSHFWQPIARY